MGALSRALLAPPGFSGLLEIPAREDRYSSSGRRTDGRSPIPPQNRAVRTADRPFASRYSRAGNWAAGHKMEWFRGPRRRGLMVTSMREGLATLAEVVRERRVLEAMHLGDQPDSAAR
jgi:hypothetical protein